MHPLVNAVIADWQVGAMVQLRGGFPLTIVADDASGTNSRGSRGQLRCSSSRVWAKTGSRSHQASSGSTLLPMGRPFRARLELAAWAQSGGLATGDLSIHKDFLLSESKRLEFRSEFFNVTNTPMLNSPYIFLNFNLALVNTSQGERNIQFALK